MEMAPPPPAVPETPVEASSESDAFAMPSFEEEAPAPPPIDQTKLPEATMMHEAEDISLDGLSFDEEPIAEAETKVEPIASQPAEEKMELDMSSIELDDLNFGFSEESAPEVEEPPVVPPTPPAPVAEEPPAPAAPEPPVSAPADEESSLEIEIPEESKPLDVSPFDAIEETPEAPPAAAEPVAQPNVQTPPPAETPPAATPSPVETPPAAATTDPDQTVAAVPPAAAVAGVAAGAASASEPPVAEPEPAPAASSEEIIFQQNFSDEDDGAMPNNWNGSYDYASLEVTSDEAVGDSPKCMKFEKKTGAGSAYYSCQFPNVGGQVCVEFDLRCDNKNKYLLGFYIEKDKDFRKSVHSIIHRTATATHPTLRIQGEPVEYTLGEWRHIKYILDLNAGFVDGYVDGQKAADHVKLENVPEYVNTLAIRDNLPTTGILRVSNIVVKKMS
jgi:hypothetical protein